MLFYHLADEAVSTKFAMYPATTGSRRCGGQNPLPILLGLHLFPVVRDEKAQLPSEHTDLIKTHFIIHDSRVYPQRTGKLKSSVPVPI